MLESQIDNLKKQLESYAKWEWYNQKCSDLNENIIPTLRPIAKIDFFCQIEDIVFPFDLKTTIFFKNYKK